MHSYKTEETEDGKVYSTTNLNFKKKLACHHKFKRVTSTEVQCLNCGVGFYDNGDFPIDELNDFYKTSFDR